MNGAESVRTLKEGDQVTVLETVTDEANVEWCKVRIDDAEGYIPASALNLD